MYEDRLVALDKKYASQGYPVIAINPNDPSVKPDDSFENMKVRAKEKGFTFPYLMDEGQKIYPQFGATKTPHVFLLDKDMVVQYIGAIDDSARSEEKVEETFLEDAIISLQMGEEVNPKVTKAVGCSIKTKS
jgi:peroxiredoxin